MLLELFLSYGSCICNLWKNIFHEISSHFLSLSTIAFSLLHHQYLVLFLSQQTNQAPSFLHTLTATSPHGFARESVAHLPSKRTSLKHYPSTPRMKSVSIAVRQLLFFYFISLVHNSTVPLLWPHNFTVWAALLPTTNALRWGSGDQYDGH